MMTCIALVCRAAREERGRSRSHIAVERNVVESTVSRFENGHMREIDVDAMVDAYVRDLDIPLGELWGRAFKMLCDDPSGTCGMTVDER